MSGRIIGAIVGATAVAGTLDIAFAGAAAGLRGIAPDRVLQYVASGVLGPSSFQGGLGAAALGLALHYFIMALMAAAFVLASQRIGILREKPILTGGLYGLFLYAFMWWVVVPLSLVNPGPGPGLWQILAQVFAHVVLVGMVIALFARRAHRV